MRANRLFVSAAAIALVAGPGLAMAQNAGPDETPPVETPPVTEAPPEDTPPVDAPPVTEPEGDDELDAQVADDVEDPTVEEGDLEEPTLEEQDDEADEDDAVDDEGQGETISALAECMPSGAELHGTGFNKGYVMSQAASSGEVMLGEGDEAMPVASPEDAQAVCDVVQDFADQAEAPDTAKGRPDWAGPKDDEQATSEDEEAITSEDDQATTSEDEPAPSVDDRRGPPAHANAGGKDKADRAAAKGKGARGNGR